MTGEEEERRRRRVKSSDISVNYVWKVPPEPDQHFLKLSTLK